MPTLPSPYKLLLWLSQRKWSVNSLRTTYSFIFSIFIHDIYDFASYHQVIFFLDIIRSCLYISGLQQWLNCRNCQEKFEDSKWEIIVLCLSFPVVSSVFQITVSDYYTFTITTCVLFRWLFHNMCSFKQCIYISSWFTKHVLIFAVSHILK